MRCKACDAEIRDHASRKQVAAGLCPVCYTDSQDAINDYEHGLKASVMPEARYRARWEDKFVTHNGPDSDE